MCAKIRLLGIFQSNSIIVPVPSSQAFVSAVPSAKSLQRGFRLKEDELDNTKLTVGCARQVGKTMEYLRGEDQPTNRTLFVGLSQRIVSFKLNKDYFNKILHRLSRF